MLFPLEGVTVNLLGTPMRTPPSPTSLKLKVNWRIELPHKQSPQTKTLFSEKILRILH